MKTKLILFITLVFLVLNGVSAQEISVPIDVKVDVVYLSSDYLEGRGTGTPGEALAAEYIASRYEELGIEGGHATSGYFQFFPIHKNPHKPSDGFEGEGRNVIGKIDNGAPTTIIIGAHYDHLGWGQSGSLHTGEKAIHNGADDNASGIASMLYMAERLVDSSFNSHNYLFIAFSGEELGLFGSSYFTDNPWLDMDNVSCMLNMDMVGRLNEERVIVVNGVGTSPAWSPALEQANTNGFTINTTDSGIGASDHTPFYLDDIPAVHFFTGQHKQYHKPSDDANLVNYQGIVEVSDFILKMIQEIKTSKKIAFTKTKDNNERKAAAFKVTLGVMPDYVYTGEGMKIDGVIEDRPAAKAGLEDGDIVIKIGEIEVKDIYNYMEALSKFEPGSTAKVTVLRNGKKVKKEVTF